ncbi:MAG: ABC transporter ATP-binding protein [Rhizobium sp.]|nr:ABC transporter ATP-binding protein [Rhizobium sp.]
MPLLSIENLDVFHGDFHAIRNLTLGIDEGQTVAIIGANGAGKSTLLNAICGLNPQKKGRITFDGADITRLRADLIARQGITMVPEGRRLFGSLSVEDNLKVGGSAGRPGPWTLDTVYGLFPRLGELRKMQAGALSGGQQQMVAIGRALMTNPRLLLCDEISLGLAPKIILDIYRCFQAIAESGVSILLIEQNVAQACNASQKVYCLLEGRVSLEGEPRELSMQAITAAYFGTESHA